MRITFGMSLDGAEWSGKPASLGEIKMGPQQFLDWLESRLGLSGIPVSAPERIDEYRRKIERVNPQWCRVSFELDPWSTARQLLARRRAEGATLLVTSHLMEPLAELCDDLYVLDGATVAARYDRAEFPRAMRELEYIFRRRYEAEFAEK